VDVLRVGHVRDQPHSRACDHVGGPEERKDVRSRGKFVLRDKLIGKRVHTALYFRVVLDHPIPCGPAREIWIMGTKIPRARLDVMTFVICALGVHIDLVFDEFNSTGIRAENLRSLSRFSAWYAST
jgi:hypothetical protein